jgi:hypothetical protein
MNVWLMPALKGRQLIDLIIDLFSINYSFISYQLIFHFMLSRVITIQLIKKQFIK